MTNNALVRSFAYSPFQTRSAQETPLVHCETVSLKRIGHAKKHASIDTRMIAVMGDWHTAKPVACRLATPLHITVHITQGEEPARRDGQSVLLRWWAWRRLLNVNNAGGPVALQHPRGWACVRASCAPVYGRVFL